MEFDWTREQLDYRDKVAAFARDTLAEPVVTDDRECRFPVEKWQRCAEFGLLGLSLPNAYSERDDVPFTTAILAMEALGHACEDNGLTFALNAQNWTVQLPLLHFGSDELKSRYLPRMSRGELIGSHALSEPDAGSDVFTMSARADRVDGGYRLNGTKSWISLAPVADLAIVFALTDPDAGKWGVSTFLVELDADGVTVGGNREKMGLRTVPFGDLEFADCFVPESHRLGPEGSGVSLSTSALEWERCAILASQVGAMQRLLDQSIAYARERQQFGRAVGKNQSVANRVVDMHLRLETSRLLLYKTAWLKEQGRSAMLEAALLKLQLAEAFVDSSLDAIRIHGARGYVAEFGIERNLRDAIGGTIYAGTSDIQRNIIAGLLGL